MVLVLSLLAGGGCVRNHELGGFDGPADGGPDQRPRLDRADLSEGPDLDAATEAGGDGCDGGCDDRSTELIIVDGGDASDGTDAVDASDGGDASDAASCDAAPEICTPLQVTSLRIEPVSPRLAIGTLVPLQAIVTYDNGASADLTTQAGWSSSLPEVARIDAGGLVTAVASGTSQIEVSAAGMVALTDVTVTDATLELLEVQPSDLTLAPGTSQIYQATGHFSDATTQDLTGQVTWASSDSRVANIFNADPKAGLARASREGTTTISASLFGLIGQGSLTVTGPALLSIKVVPLNANLGAGETRQYRATGTFSDGGNQDITTHVVWAINPSSVASVSNVTGSQGQVSGIRPGTASVSARSGSLEGSATLTVH